jgi:mannose-6-phosphate isomerase-like protein (cupin superfamily)
MGAYDDSNNKRKREGEMKGFSGDIESMTLSNDNFRRVLYTGSHCQLVLMSLRPGEEIGLEVHEDNDQFFRFEAGEGRVVIDGNEYSVTDGTAVVVPAGARHNVINTSASLDLRMYTIYSPPHHKDGIVRATKAEAESDAPDYDGQNSE